MNVANKSRTRSGWGGDGSARQEYGATFAAAKLS